MPETVKAGGEGESEAVYIRPAHTRIPGEIDGVKTYPVLLPELLLDSPDAELFNDRIERLYQELIIYYQNAAAPRVTWSYEASRTGQKLVISLWRNDREEWIYQVDLDTGEIPYLEDPRQAFLPENHAPELVSNRYEGFPEPSWDGTLVLPEILLNSPDAETVNREIEAMYCGSAAGDIMLEPAECWDAQRDNVWYAAYEWDGVLSVGVICNNVFGSYHVQRGWNFALETGLLLSEEELLAHLGVTPEEFTEAVRRELLMLVQQGRDLILEEDAGDFIAAHAEENYARLCEEIRAGMYDPETSALYVTDTGEVHLSVWNPSEQYYYDGGDGDWTEELALNFPQSVG